MVVSIRDDESMKADLFEWAHRHRDNVVWMSQNTNNIPTTPAIAKAMREAIDSGEYHQYPFARGLSGLPEAIREDLNLPEHDVLMTNGGIEGLYAATRALLSPLDEVISTDPSFLPIHQQVTISNAKLVELNAYKPPYKLVADEVLAAVTPKTKAILLIDPLNPMGTGYSRSEVKAIAEVAQDHRLWLFDDVTYRDFARRHTLASDFYPEGTVIGYSFSKSCGLAGLRIGSLVAPPELMKAIKPYDTNVLSVNVVAQHAALAALGTKSRWINKVVETTRKNAERIRVAAKKVDGCSLPVFPPEANMFVVDISGTGIHPDAVEERLLHDHKVFVRSGTYVSKRFGERFIRVSFSVPAAECKRFEVAFPAVMERLAAN